MTEQEFTELFNKAYKDLISTFNQSTLRRTTTSKAAKNILLGLNNRIDKYKSNPNLDARQLTQLNNMIEEVKTGYINKVNKQSTLIDREKNKAFKLKLKEDTVRANIEKSISPNIKKIPTTSSSTMVGGLIESLGGFTKAKKTGTKIVTYDAMKAQADKVNFNLKGYKLFENAAYNAKIHGVSGTIQEIDEAVKNKKIDVSEANKIKSALKDKGVSAKLSQIGDVDQVKEFNKPQFQKAFKSFLSSAFSKYMKVVPVVGTPFMLRDMKKQYDEIMEESKKPIQPLTYRSGGKVKRTKPKTKPYAMGGKVYSNSVRKPNY
tara:strand:- start:49 stop:1005 length:957 start_codon:yes stop_codon:yes gene_type:complete